MSKVPPRKGMMMWDIPKYISLTYKFNGRIIMRRYHSGSFLFWEYQFQNRRICGMSMAFGEVLLKVKHRSCVFLRWCVLGLL